ncbi:MAG: FAD-dependent monooxygenase [Rhodoferax sp.]
MTQILIAGGGIGGLSAAIALAREGHAVRVLERAAVFSEVGAGIQLGPNVTRILHQWGLRTALDAVVCSPSHLQVRCAMTGRVLARMALGRAFVAQYGAPYLTIHRADLHSILAQNLRRFDSVSVCLGATVRALQASASDVRVLLEGDDELHADVLIGADGGFSTVRRQLWGDGLPKPSGHLAYRALVEQHTLPTQLRSDDVTVWMGPKMHLVHYPVRQGECLNLVAIVDGEVQGNMDDWDHSANAQDLRAALRHTWGGLQELIGAISKWRLWPLSIRAPMRSADEHARGRVALLGDAAHPMVPYLAQGAAMAIEDAAELARQLGGISHQTAASVALTDALQGYAQQRWQRNARVQARALRNGRIFHVQGPLRWGRDWALRLLGQRLLELPWLYGGGPLPHPPHVHTG